MASKYYIQKCFVKGLKEKTKRLLIIQPYPALLIIPDNVKLSRKKLNNP